MTSAFDDAAVIVRRSARLSALLAATDEAPRRAAFPAVRVQQAAAHGVFVRRMRIAAAAALLLAGAGVPPVRAWIVDSAKAIWHVVAGPRRADVQPVPVAAPATPDAMGTVTIPVTESFALRLATRQAKGVLTIETTSDSLASATVSGERDAAELAVMPDGLRIVNGTASTAGYLVRIPASVTKLTVQIGREPARVLRPAAGQSWTIDLGARRNNR